MTLPSPSTRPPRVLVADDDESILRVLADTLTPMGVQIVSARGGREAQTLFQRERPDVLVLDIQMAPPTGIDLCRAIKRDPKTFLTPVVIITGVGRAREKLQALEAGADHYFDKPINLWEFKARIGTLIRLKRFTDRWVQPHIPPDAPPPS